MSDNQPSVDVLVVGAGPAGLSTAIGLLQHGLSVRLIDQLDAPPPYSKAQIVHARSLEIFERLGVAQEAIAHGRKLRAITSYAKPDLKRVTHVPIEGIDSEYGYFLSISQADTERVLTARLLALGGRIERGVKLDAFTQDDEKVTATLDHADGPREIIHTRYLVGCDGAHSTVRHQLHFGFEGSTYEERIIQADVRVDLPMHEAHDEIVMFLAPDGVMALFPLVGERRYRLLIPLLEGADYEPTLENFQMLASKFGPPDARVSDPAWMVGFKIHRRLASKYRDRRAFLVGDAAHIHSPMGAQGMNTGIQDAHNLAWKIALVHRGLARPALLDSYEAERRPVAAHTLSATDRAWGGAMNMATLRHPLAVEARNRVMGFVTSLDAVASTVMQGVSMLQIGYPESPVCAQHRASIARVNVLTSERSEDPSVRDWVDFAHGPAPGFRAPDGHIGASRLFEQLHRTHHTLLLFDGAAHTESGYRTMESIAQRTSKRFGDHVRVVMVVPRAERPGGLRFEGEVLLDAEGALHRRYGARSECLYLVRPDGHVAFRSQPADPNALEAYLDKVLV